MSLEFSASRLLIPIYGSSIYTWGSLVGVILSGLSLGYHVGGRLADKIGSSFVKFCSIIFSAGLYIVFIPFISVIIIEVSNSITSEFQYACLLATFLLLIVPTFLLGLVSPYAVKLAIKNILRVGNISGNLYSAGTMGSIIGTFLTVFVLIPTSEIRTIIFGLGLSLIISSALIGLGRVPKVLAGFVILFLYLSSTFLTVQSIPYYSGNLIYQKETPYSHLDVVDYTNHRRSLLLDGYTHSVMNKDNPTQLLFYTNYFPLGFIFNPTAKKVLFLGGGGFSGPKYFLKTHPNVTVDVVDIDPVVIDVAKKYFDVNSSDPRLKIYNEDARDFLSSTNQKYDIIVLDAYSKTSVPFHLMTLEYYQLLYNRLTTPNGVIVSNQLGSLDQEQDTSKLYRAVYKTISQVFSSAAVYIFPFDNDVVHDYDVVQNIILVAIKDPDKVYYSSDDIRQRQQQQKIILIGGTSNNIYDNGSPNYYRHINYADHLLNRTKIRTGDVPILTDQFAPVERLLDPITSSHYNVGEKQIPTNIKVDLYSLQGTILGLVLPVATAVVWIFYMKRKIWLNTI